MKEKSNAKKIYDICTKTRVNVDIDKVLGLKENELRDILSRLVVTEKDVHYRLMAKGAVTINQALSQIIDLMIKKMDKVDIEKVISDSKIMIFTKKLGRYAAKLEHKEYDDPKDLWLKSKARELEKAILTQLKTILKGLK